tara:strand:+ start:53 stop:565 length:513 start_codon:yes stop_codon:yes gene_type:complete
MESKMSWLKQYETDLGIYDYKGKSVIAKTTKEKMDIAEKHKSEHYLDVSKPPSKYYFVLTSDTEESIDSEIKRNEEVKKTISSSYVSTSRKPKRKDIHLDIKKSVSNFINENKVKKNAFIQAIIKLNPETSHWTVRGQIKKLFKERFIEVDKSVTWYKRFVVKGKYWREV